MMFLTRRTAFLRRRTLIAAFSGGDLSPSTLSGWNLLFSTCREEAELKDFIYYLDSLKNFEKLGVPKDAGTDSDDGFDLGRMHRLMDRLGNPQSKYKAIHIAGTKGKGSTASFLSNILRSEGYSVGCYSSPHVVSIRERMSIGKQGEPVSAIALSSHFHRIRNTIDEAIRLENGCLSHFEVLTAIAFSLFAQENVDVAVIETGLGGARDATNILSSSGLAASIITTIGEEHLMALGGSLESVAMAKAGIIKQGRPLVLGGPFLPHIERILRDKASSMCAPVISASDPGIRTTIKGLSMFDGRYCQLCDIMIRVDNDFKLFIELSNMKMHMLGRHQLQNAATAACAALSLRTQGWGISDGSIRLGLENTSLLGRSQFLSSKDAKVLGVPGTTVLLDGAHTKDSAKALVDTIRLTFPEAQLALIVAMASDKDHLAFAREFLLDKNLGAVFLTEAEIAGENSRTTPASLLRDYWVQASGELGISTFHDGIAEYGGLSKNELTCSERKLECRIILRTDKSLEASMRMANEFFRNRIGNQSSLLVVTGSLHIVSSLLVRLRD